MQMKLKSTFGAFLDPVADKVLFVTTTTITTTSNVVCEFNIIFCTQTHLQLMVAATLILLCTRPLKVVALARAPWLLIIPSITIIGREVMPPISTLVFTYGCCSTTPMI